MPEDREQTPVILYSLFVDTLYDAVYKLLLEICHLCNKLQSNTMNMTVFPR